MTLGVSEYHALEFSDLLQMRFATQNRSMPSVVQFARKMLAKPIYLKSNIKTEQVIRINICISQEDTRNLSIDLLISLALP